METLWIILFGIFISTGLLVHYSFTHNWSIKAKIFLVVFQLCLCSVVLVVGFCSHQSLITNLSCIVAFGVLIKILKSFLNDLEKEAIEKVLEKQQRQNHEQEIIDVEDFTVCN